MTRSFLLLAAVGLGGCWYSGESDGYRYGGPYERPSPSGTPTSTNPGVPQRPPTSTDPCIDPAGFGGRGCYKCPPKTSEQFLSACTASRFESFDNAARIPDFDPSNPKPALGAQGPTPPAFEPGGTTTEPEPPPAACALVSKPNPVMLLGATGFRMEALAKAMGKDATLYFQESGSCDAVASVILRTKLHGVVTTYDSEGQKSRCTLTEEHPADLALSALFASSCVGASRARRTGRSAGGRGGRARSD